MSAPGYTVGNTTINVASTTNWPTSHGTIFAVDEVDSSGNRVAGTYNEFRGLVASATQLSGVAYIGGDANRNYSAGASTRVYILVSSHLHNRLIDALSLDHSQLNGGHEIATNYDPSNPTLETQKWVGVSSAVNELTVTNAITGTPPILAPSGETNVNLHVNGKGTGGVIAKLHSAPGVLNNGKIVASVASNDLTLALKTLAGTDPSATDPVYVNIGDTIRTVTSALAVTKNDGTNWMNLGSTEHATQDVDLFAYMGFNATDGVTIGFSRIPYARIYSDFSPTSTNEKYAAISNITTAAGTDNYVVIGRFNATLSAGAAYTWSIPGTAVVVQRPIYETRLLTYVPVYVNLSGGTTNYAKYQIKDRSITWRFKYTLAGAGISGSVTTTVPFSFGSQYTTDRDPIEQNGTLYDATGARWFPRVLWSSATVAAIGYLNASPSFANLSSTLPFTWANTDEIHVVATHYIEA
jgi:hypothetical protein